MSFNFNKETRRSLRERLRDGINIGVSTVVQAPGNILNSAVGGGGGGSDGGSNKSLNKSPVHQQIVTTATAQKSHSLEATSSHEDNNSSINNQSSSNNEQQPPISPSYLTATATSSSENNNQDGSNNSRSGSVSSCSSSSTSSPSKYRTYVVKANDTVTSIAASFDCTPSELMRVNRLITARVLFPGQVLKIPNKPATAAAIPTTTTKPSVTTATGATDSQQSSNNNNNAATSIATANLLESITYAQRKFLKIKVRHVTDGNGVVSGTLLITPNAVMFDPNVSDPLVIEQGAEMYGVIVPIEYVVGAGIWSDVCGMRVRGKEGFVVPGPGPVLWGGTGGGAKKVAKVVVNSDEGEEKKEEVEDVKVEEAEVKVGDDEVKSSSQNESSSSPSRRRSSSSTSPKLEEVTEHPLCEEKSHESIIIRSVSTWYFCLTIGRPKVLVASGDGDAGGANRRRNTPFCVTYGQKNFVRPEFWFSVAREQVPELYKYWMFWWPSVYGEVDFKAIGDRGYEAIDWDNLSVLGVADSPAGGVTNATAPGGRTRSSGGNDDNDDQQTVAQELNELTKESWEVVTNEELRNLLAIGGEEMMTINLPDLIGGKSEILEEEDMRNITRHLTARAEGYPWTQVFSSSRDGFSLNSLYRKNSLMQEDSPVLMLVQDTNGRVFGALVSCGLHTSDSFYGTGQSFLFTLRPEFNVYKWTGENLFFVKGNHDGVWIGAGDGKFGLYVDGDLNCGRTETCQTYGNAPLTEPQDFIIKTLECWAFGNFVLNDNISFCPGGGGGGVAGAVCNVAIIDK